MGRGGRKYNHTKRRSTGFSPASKQDKKGGKERKQNKTKKQQETMKRREIMLKYVPNINPGEYFNSA